jgi:hypothetical protein
VITKEQAGHADPVAAALKGTSYTSAGIDDPGMRDLFERASEIRPPRCIRPVAAKVASTASLPMPDPLPPMPILPSRLLDELTLSGSILNGVEPPTPEPFEFVEQVGGSQGEGSKGEGDGEEGGGGEEGGEEGDGDEGDGEEGGGGEEGGEEGDDELPPLHEIPPCLWDWDELSPEQKAHAATLGYDEDSWYDDTERTI